MNQQMMMSQFWHILVIVVVLVSLVGYLVFLFVHSKARSSVKADESTGHTWDGIYELNRPMPKWWLYTFVGLTIWAIGFCFYYPALGNYQGLGGWSQEDQYKQEMLSTDAKYSGIFKGLAKGSFDDMIKNPSAMETGRRLFLQNCSVCHASDGQGGKGFPNLADKDWLYGGDQATIIASITNGRTGMMPAQIESLKAVAKANNITGDVADDVSEYVLTLSGLSKDTSDKVKNGKVLFDGVCSACHMMTGKGMQALGAPNLTDKIWLYVDPGDQDNAKVIKDMIVHNINNGRSGVMPAHPNMSAEQIKIIGAYVYSLSEGAK